MGYTKLRKHAIDVTDDPNGKVCDFDYYKKQLARDDYDVTSSFQSPPALKPFNKFLQ
jgi:hypothetical protein